MNIALWIVQGFVALVFLATGIMKATTSKDRMDGKGALVQGFSTLQVRLIGIAEVLGALGLVLPSVTGILPWLTPLAAAALVVLMIGAIFTHLRLKEAAKVLAPLILGSLGCCVALGRFFLLPLGA